MSFAVTPYGHFKVATKPGLWANIHAKRKRGEKPAKPGDKDYPKEEAWRDTVNSLNKSADSSTPIAKRTKSKGLDSNVNLLYDEPRHSWAMPRHLRDSSISAQEASKMLAAMRGEVRHGALDDTRLDWHGLQWRGYVPRVEKNKRISSLGKFWHTLGAEEELAAMPDVTQQMGDLYMPYADVVSVPSGSPGIAMHELGHAIDFNEFPADSSLRHFTAAMYRNWAPTLWQEHAAWRKGREALLNAYAKKKLDADIAFKALQSGKGAKRVGLGSYWGGALGGLAGTGLGLYAAIQAAQDGSVVPGLPLIGGGVGGALGALSGIGIGNLLARKPAAEDAIVSMMAKRYAQLHNVGLDEAKTLVQKQLDAVRKRQKSKPKTKAASVQFLDAALKQARCWSGYEPVPGKAPYSEGSCRPVQRKAKAKKPAAEKAAALTRLQLLLTKHAEGGAWTRAEGKSESGGLNAKGRASLKAQGQDIKPPVTESNPTGERADRKSSFCARMGGMKKKLTSKETANDPDSRINKALRKWKC